MSHMQKNVSSSGYTLIVKLSDFLFCSTLVFLMKFPTFWFGTCLFSAAALVMVALQRAEEENNDMKVQVMGLVANVWCPSIPLNCSITRAYCVSEYDRFSEAISYRSESYTPNQLLVLIKSKDLHAKRARLHQARDAVTSEVARLERTFDLEPTGGNWFEYFAKNREFAKSAGMWRGYFLSETAEDSFVAVMNSLPKMALSRAFYETCKSPVFLRVSSRSPRVAAECKKSETLQFDSVAALRAHLWRSAVDIYIGDPNSRAAAVARYIPAEYFLSGYRKPTPVVSLYNFLVSMRVPVHVNDTQNAVALVETFVAYGMEKLRVAEAGKVWHTASWRLSWTQTSNALLTPVRLFAGVAESVRFWPRYFEAISPIQVESAYNEFMAAARDLMNTYMPLHVICDKLHHPAPGFGHRVLRTLWTRDVRDLVFNDSWGEIFRLYNVCERLPAALGELPMTHVIIDELFNATERANIDGAANRVDVYNSIFRKGELPVVDEACTICYEINSNFLTSCGHYYHRACLDRWMETHNTCPMCRRGI